MSKRMLLGCGLGAAAVGIGAYVWGGWALLWPLLWVLPCLAMCVAGVCMGRESKAAAKGEDSPDPTGETP